MQYLIGMNTKSFLIDLRLQTTKLLIVAICLNVASVAKAQEDVSTQNENFIDVNDGGDNISLNPVDETKIEVEDKEEIESILSELRKLKKQAKPKVAKIKLRPKKIVQNRKRDKSLSARLLQAKELMGKQYKSYFKVAKLVKNPDRHIHDYVKEAFSDFDKKTRRKAHDTSKAILSESKKYGFDPFFLLAVIENESRFNLKARGDAGEIGLMQILPDTARWICEKNNWKWKGERTLLDPVQNVKIGAAYLNLLRNQFESESQLYISAYNMGAKNVYRALSHQVTPKDYHSKVLEFYISYYRQIKKEFEDQET